MSNGNRCPIHRIILTAKGLKLKCPKCDYSIKSKDLRIFNRKMSKKGE